MLFLAVLLIIAEMKMAEFTEQEGEKVERKKHKKGKKGLKIPVNNKKNCDKFKDKVKKAEQEAQALRKKFRNECLKKAKIEQKSAEELICKLAIRKAHIKIKQKAYREAMKMATKDEEKSSSQRSAKLIKSLLSLSKRERQQF